MTSLFRTFNRRKAFPYLLGLASSAVLSCKDPVERAPVVDAVQDQPDVIRVDPSLLEQGRIAVTEVVPFDHGDALVIPGEVAPAPDGEAEIGALVAGRVASLEAVEGTTVKSGQVLAWIDSPEIGTVRADLARATAHTAAASKRLERQLALHSQAATSQSALDEARAALASAEADQQAARARLGSVGVSGGSVTGKLPLRSPIDGVIVERNATLGGAVAPELTLFRVINPRKLRVKAQWSETLGPVPEIGSKVQLNPRKRRAAGTPSSRCHGNVEVHLGVIDSITRSTTLQIVPHTDCPPWTAGAYLDVLVDAPQSAAREATDLKQVPLEAVVDLRGVPTVFIATQERGGFEARQIAAKPSVGNVVPVEVGVNVGEQVATNGVILLKGEALRDILGGD